MDISLEEWTCYRASRENEEISQEREHHAHATHVLGTREVIAANRKVRKFPQDFVMGIHHRWDHPQ